MSNNKGGRPRKQEAEKRKHTVTAHLTEAEYDKLQARAEQFNLPVNKALRKLALDRRMPRQPKPKVDYDTYVRLGRIGNALVGALKDQGQDEKEQIKQLKDEISKLRLDVLGVRDDTEHK